MACPQKEISRGISGVSIPYRDLNHCLPWSNRLTKAMGTSQTAAAMRVISSKTSSGAVSMTRYRSSAAWRSASLMGMGASNAVADAKGFTANSRGLYPITARTPINPLASPVASWENDTEGI